MLHFKELKVWQKAFALSVTNYKITAAFPAHEKFGLVSQINRAGISIPSNIDEGSSRSSQKEYKHFIEIALGSSFELETQLLIAKELNYGDLTLITENLARLSETQKMLYAFAKVLERANK
ncbi:MAG: four helix bundle protein [Chitinophagaceae bacterium]